MNPIPLGRVFGFPTSVDPTALLLLAFYVFGGGGTGPEAMIRGGVLALIVFGSVLVHELGHAVMARGYRLGPIEIVLHGFGGFTRFSRNPTPRQGILLTLAGPGASLGLAVLATIAGLVAGAALPQSPMGPMLALAGTLNFFWAVFNVLPMYPLDGGLIVFHALSLRSRSQNALRTAARVGVVTGVAIGAIAVATHQVFLAIIVLMALMRSVPLAMGSPTR